MQRKILVVEDNVINRELLVQILNQDYEILEAYDGKMALDILKLEYEKISAILLDIIMPIMDGYQVLEAISKNSFFSKIPVIVMSSNNDKDSEIKALELGAHDFVRKPYEPIIIKQRLKNTINLRETASLINDVEKDSQTGVYNKEFFYKKVEGILKIDSETEYDIMALNINRYKLVKEIIGVHASAELIKFVASSLQRNLYDIGICGRISSDVFVGLIDRKKDIKKIAKKIFYEVKEYLKEVNIRIVFGIFEITDYHLPVSIMCDRALAACDSIKDKNDTNIAFFEDKIIEDLKEEQFIIEESKIGLSEKQFVVYYQPKYSLITGEMVGAEALVRWIHPKRGFMSPAEFIPVLENNGLITNLDIYVWNVVCKDLKKWTTNNGGYVPISVNMSRSDIYNPNIVSVLTNLISINNLKPEDLHIEITESSFMSDYQQLISVVNELSKFGFIIEIDDFGTGYSSLNVLSELPINVLKIDMSFIRNGFSDKKRKNIIESIIKLAKKLSLEVIAEGVETLDEIKALKKMGCDIGQGYYYARPMEKEKFEEMHLSKLQK